MTEEVILVDQDDRVLGTMEKLEAHQTGVLHRAFSVFLFNSRNELLLQQRALDKYHSAGLWSNTCCSHPRPGEDSMAAAKRRLWEEMGLSADLKFISKLPYKTRFENGLFEHELDYIYIGKTDSLPTINPEEAKDFKYLSFQQIKAELKSRPDQYTVWFKLALPQIEQFCKLTGD